MSRTGDGPTCPQCSMTDVLEGADHYECATCGFEFDRAPAVRVVTDANGKPLKDGDTVTLIKDLKINGKSGKLKVGTRIKGIRIVGGDDHEIDCKIDGRPMLVTAAYVKLV